MLRLFCRLALSDSATAVLREPMRSLIEEEIDEIVAQARGSPRWRGAGVDDPEGRGERAIDRRSAVRSRSSGLCDVRLSVSWARLRKNQAIRDDADVSDDPSDDVRRPQSRERRLTEAEIDEIMAQSRGASAMAGHDFDDPDVEADERAALRGEITFDEAVRRVVERVLREDP